MWLSILLIAFLTIVSVLKSSNLDPLMHYRHRQTAAAVQFHLEYYDFYDDAGEQDIRSNYSETPTTTTTTTTTPKTTVQSTRCVDAQQKQSFCEHVPDYPAAHIERQMAADPERFAELLGGEVAPVSPVVESRFGADVADGRPLCARRETIIYPKMGQTVRNTWMYIVNSRRYQQGIRVEMCDRVDGSCEWPSGNGGYRGFRGGGGAAYWPVGMRSVCRQKFTYRQLLAVDGYGRPVMEAFRMPCCCSCVLVQQIDY